MLAKKHNIFIFDFDGTLFDSRIGIISGVKYATDFFGIENPSEEILTSFIGPPLGWSFSHHFKLSKSDALIAISKLREYYGDKGIFESKPYEGILPILEKLKAEKKKLAIATAKPTKYANQILVHNDWADLFDVVHGSSLKGELFPKEKTISACIDDLNVFDKSKAIMFGDTIYDIKGAQEVGVDSVAVIYGYGKEQDLKDARPNYFAETVQDLNSLIF